MTSLRLDADGPVVHRCPGQLAYDDGWTLQKELVALRQNDEIGDQLITLEHDPVYTLGSSAHDEHVLFDEARRAAEGIELIQVDRGGDVTYHGPGQLTAYPIIKLRELRGVVPYVRALEQVCIDVLASYGLSGERLAEYPGVWVGNDKVVAIGARVTRGVTMHGIGMNVTTDLSHFAGIVACGIADRGVASLASLGVDTDVAEASRRFSAAFGTVFGAEMVAGPRS